MMLLFGAVAIVAVLVVVATARLAARKIRRSPGSPAAPSQAQWDAALRALAYASPGFVYLQPLVDDVRMLSDEQLCQAWCASYKPVTTAKSARQLRIAAEERRSYLDELDRRYPLAVSTWLASVPIASADPFPYLTHGFDDQRQEDR